jgi:hypothetical protein
MVRSMFYASRGKGAITMSKLKLRKEKMMFDKMEKILELVTILAACLILIYIAVIASLVLF